MEKLYQKDPLVSVIIPVYNVEKYLEKTVSSVINQNYKNIEVLLVDDGSPDNCPQICDRLEKTYDEIKVIHQKNGGLSSARNTGLARIGSDSKYILFLDSDDRIYSDAISNMVLIAEHYNSDMVIPDRYTQVDEITGKQELRFHFTKDCYYNDPVKYALEVILGKGRGARSHSLLYKTSCIIDNDVKFPEGYTSEDVVFNLRLMPYLKRIDFYDKPTVYYLKRKGSITTSFDKKYASTIWFIDEQASAFIEKIGAMNDASAILMRESLLCRNTLAYVKKILSKTNIDSARNKKLQALKVLKDPHLDGVFTRKHNIPYFQSPKGKIYYKIMYFLLRKNRYKLAVSIAALFC